MDAAYTGKQIAERRKQLGMTQKELAEQLHVTDKAVSKWERGINFPDLGLMEALAKALDTTPAALLGLENADQHEMIHSIAEISEEQLEEARKDLRLFGWGAIVTAVLLAMTYHLTQKRAVEVYYLLHCMITLTGIVGLVYLFKYGEIKKWEPGDLFIFYGGLFSVLIYLGIQFLTGHSPHPFLGLVLIMATACCTQWLFCRIMRPDLMKAFPMLAATAYALWALVNGFLIDDVAACAVCCAAVWLLCLLRTHRKKSQS